MPLIFLIINNKTTNMKKICVALFMLVSIIAFSNNDKGCHKSEGKCTGSKYCSACKNCKYCKYCNAGGVCGVCSPESFEEKRRSKNLLRRSNPLNLMPQLKRKNKKPDF
jgi:hypothetical protein